MTGARAGVIILSEEGNAMASTESRWSRTSEKGGAVYARSSTFFAQPGAIDDCIGYVRDQVMPAALALKGCTGLSMICHRDSGRCIITSAWSTQSALDSSEETIRPVLQGGSAIFGADPSVDIWEIPVMHRHATSGEGACVRCTWLSLDVGALPKAIENYRITMLPALDEMDGFCSASLMVNRDTGHAVSSATFDSRDAMVASRPGTAWLRSRAGKELGAEVTDVQEFKLTLAHLHVPEMARAMQP
jgi:hypothetical protein